MVKNDDGYMWLVVSSILLFDNRRGWLSNVLPLGCSLLLVPMPMINCFSQLWTSTNLRYQWWITQIPLASTKHYCQKKSAQIPHLMVFLVVMPVIITQTPYLSMVNHPYGHVSTMIHDQRHDQTPRLSIVNHC